MLIKYCPNCEGKPYTSNLFMAVCPTCGHRLSSQEVDEASLTERKQFGLTADLPFDEKDYRDGKETGLIDSEPNTVATVDKGEVTTVLPDTSDLLKQFESNTDSQTMVDRHPGTTVKGKVIQYSCSGREDGNYRRLFPLRLYQAIVYRQRLEDVLHRFTVRVEQEKDGMGYKSYVDVPVNVHGTIAGGEQIAENREVEVCGKYCNGILMAERIDVINTGYKSRINFQRSVGAIVLGIVSVLALIFMIYIGASGPADFFSNIGTFLGMWFGCMIIKLIAYIVFSFTRTGMTINMIFRQRRFSFSGLVIVSLVCAVVLYFGFISLVY